MFGSRLYWADKLAPMRGLGLISRGGGYTLCPKPYLGQFPGVTPTDLTYVLRSCR